MYIQNPPTCRSKLGEKHKKETLGSVLNHLFHQLIIWCISRTLDILMSLIINLGEAEEGTVAEPDTPEGAKEELEVIVRVAAHARHPVAAVSICPETILFIEGGIPLTFRQLVALLIEDEGRALCASVDGLLSCQEHHVLLRGGHAANDLLERANAELVARLQDPSRIREVLVGDLVVVVIERLLLATLMPLIEFGEPSRVIIIVRHRDDSEVHEQSKLFNTRWTINQLLQMFCNLFRIPCTLSNHLADECLLFIESCQHTIIAITHSINYLRVYYHTRY